MPLCKDVIALFCAPFIEWADRHGRGVSPYGRTSRGAAVP
jgi:hypothetical protein